MADTISVVPSGMNYYCGDILGNCHVVLSLSDRSFEQVFVPDVEACSLLGQSHRKGLH